MGREVAECAKRSKGEMAMKRVRGRVFVGLMVVGFGGVVAPACAHDDTTIFVRDVLAAAPVAAGQQCVFTSDPSQQFITSGVLDIDFLDTYEAEFLVGNQLVPEANPSTPATETSFVEIQGAVVRITDALGNPLNAYTTLTGTSIPPAVGTTPSYAPIGVTILDEATVAGAAVTGGEIVRLITYASFFGKTLGGLSVTSNEFEFPVDVCRGCLIGFSPQDISPLFAAPNCVGSGSGTTTTQSTPCVQGQDSTVDCSECQAIPACHGTVPATVVGAGIVDAGGGG
jgi:hypothetical protein